MSTLDGAILRIMQDGKHRSIKDILQEIHENYEIPTPPRSTLWYHIVKMYNRGVLKSKYTDGSNRVEYIITNKGMIKNG